MVMVIKGRRGKKYGYDRYYGVRLEIEMPGQAGQAPMFVYVLQTSSKQEALITYRGYLEGRIW